MRDLLIGSGLTIIDGVLVLPDQMRRVKIDVGLSTNAPQSAIWMANDSELYILGFEPLNSNLEMLSSGKSDWTTKISPESLGPRMAVIPTALSARHLEDGLTFYVTKNDPGCSSLLKPKSFDVLRTEIVSVWSLNDFFEYFPFKKFPIVDHLKIDAQGADFKILQGCNRYLSCIFAVTVEMDADQYEGADNTLFDITEFLSPFGFKLIKPGLLWTLWTLWKGYKIDIETDDPTFINFNQIQHSKKRRFFLYQRG